jgi:D-serine deaminase-like pyridoxal phosphate-dependent protein
MNFTLETVPTPCIVVNLQTVRSNLRKMADYASQHRLAVRPHFKTHKSLRMAKLQLEAGAIGFACAKAGEAETLGQQGKDILLAYPALDEARTARLARLAHDMTIRVAVDSSLAIDRLAQAARSAGSTLGILVDIDVGFHRTGVQTIDQAAQLAGQAASTNGARLDGIMVYPGHIGAPLAEQPARLALVQEIAHNAVERFRASGLSAPIVSGGSTPTGYNSHLVPALTEIRPGTYIYNDRNTLAGGYCTLDECAATIIATVVSDAVPNKVVVDAGSKTLTSDRLNTNRESGGHGFIPAYPDAVITRLSEEHGEIDLTQSPQRPKLGDRIAIIPNHICPCINLQDAVWLQEDDGELHALPVDARGKLI